MDSAYTVEQVASYVDNEGLGYAIQHGLSAERIADPELARLWAEAKTALDGVDSYLEAHRPVEEDGPVSALSGPVSVSHTQILCDRTPAPFKGVRKKDAYGYRQIDCTQGGSLRLNMQGGRFGNDPEVYVKGDFDAAELLGYLREIGPASAAHIGQSLRITDAKGTDWYVSFRGEARLNGELL